jgi:RNA polymerase sigma-B factor
MAAFDPATTDRERMIERYLPLADRLARRYRHSSEPLDDLTQVARLGLVKAVDRWDPDRGNTFATFAVPTIRGELQRHFRDRTWTIRPPRDLQELYLRVQRTRASLATEIGRDPTADDVADAIGCRTEDVVEAIAVGDAYSPRSLDVPVKADEPDGVTGADLLPDDGRELARIVDATALMELAQDLDDRTLEVLRLSFHEDRLQREIGELVGCSQMHVSRILRDAMRKMREAADEAGVVFD